jgi:hypothetical protein
MQSWATALLLRAVCTVQRVRMLLPRRRRVRVRQRAVVQPQDVVTLVKVLVGEGGLPLHLQQEHGVRLQHLHGVRPQGEQLGEGAARSVDGRAHLLAAAVQRGERGSRLPQLAPELELPVAGDHAAVDGLRHPLLVLHPLDDGHLAAVAVPPVATVPVATVPVAACGSSSMAAASSSALGRGDGEQHRGLARRPLLQLPLRLQQQEADVDASVALQAVVDDGQLVVVVPDEAADEVRMKEGEQARGGKEALASLLVQAQAQLDGDGQRDGGGV